MNEKVTMTVPSLAGNVWLWFQCAYVTRGNRIIERCHRTIKTISARKHDTIQEIFYWHNVTPKDGVSSSSAPANMIHKYHVRIKVFDAVLPTELQDESGAYKMGDLVWLKLSKHRCTTRYKVGCMTGVNSQQNLMEFHVS